MCVNGNPLRDVQDEAPVDHADCGHEIYHGEFTAEWEGEMLCPDCFRAAVKRALRDNPAQVALEMGLSVERHG